MELNEPVDKYCDFCGAVLLPGTEVWAWPCADFTLPLQGKFIWRSFGDWDACQFCNFLLIGNDHANLKRCVIAAFIYAGDDGPAATARARLVVDTFARHRLAGPAQRIAAKGF